MSEQRATQDWTNYAGAVAAAYEHNREPVSVIEGPTGGGKTQASARRNLRVALMQDVSPRDGWRKARICCVAPSYRILWDTAIPSFRKVFPDILGGKFTGGRGDPADYALDIKMPKPDGRADLIHLELQFRALRDESAEEFVRGREVTGWWFPEMDILPSEDLLGLATNRVGRYPEPDDRPAPDPARAPPWQGVFGDTNTPVIGSWFYNHWYLERKNRAGFFRQPPAILSDGTVNPAAENLHNLRKIRADYYEAMIAAQTMSDYDIRRLLMCKPGWSRFGKPVHEHFDDQRMVSKVELPIDPELTLRIGVDAGNTLKPAATFSQRTWSGQKRVLACISPTDRQMDLGEFAAEVRRYKDTLFREVRTAVIVVDPSSRAKSTENRQISYAQILQARAKIPVRLAPSNDPGKRRSAVDALMRRNAGPGEPALIIDPRCTPLIAALAGGYRFKKSGDAYSPQPEKNDHSHVAEAFQYEVLDDLGLGPVDLIPPRAGGLNHPGVILD